MQACKIGIVILMVYCHNCGSELPEDAVYCPKCGTKTTIAGSSGRSPSDELRDSLSRMSIEMEKTFNIAAKEVQEAFQRARNNVQKSMNNEVLVCPNCGEKNPSTGAYCHKCGKTLEAKAAEPKEGNNQQEA
jgi:uncharacterized membrane protein YvbJ